MNRALIALLILPFLAFTIALDVAPQDPVTLDELNCVINVSGPGDLNANITWFVDGVPHTTSNQTLALTSGEQATTSEPGTVLNDDTERGQEWWCQATVYNQTQTQAVNATSVEILNSAPRVDSLGIPDVLFENEPYTFQATATDSDGDPVVFASVVINATGTPEPETPLFTITSAGFISFTPQFEHVGNHTMGILATDGELVGGRNVLFTVQAINEDPYFVPPLQDQQATQNETFSYVVQGFDRENDPFKIVMVDSPLPELQLVPINDTHAEINFTTGTVRHRHGGLHEITLTIFETANTTKNTTESFMLNVTVFNELPEFGPIISPMVAQGGEFNMTINATDDDAEDTLIFSIETSCPLPNPWSIETVDNSSSLAIGNIYVEKLTNDHVACRDVTLVVTDFDDQGVAKDEVRHDITLNISNVNDPPEIHEISTFDNYLGQTNMSELVAPTGLEFRYRVNATDPDLLTYEGDELFFSDNSTLFTIDDSTGWIVFTPTLGDVGEYSINITVEDLAEEQDSRVLELEIVENNPPTLIDPGVVQCDQHEDCTVLLEASDPEGDNLTYTAELVDYFVWSNQTTDAELALDMQTANITHATYNFSNEEVGWFEYNITVTDFFGAQDTGTLLINVSNINDPPLFSPSIVFPQPVVESFPRAFFIRADDPDFVNTDAPRVEENLTLIVDINGPNPSLFTPVRTQSLGTEWFIQFTPEPGDEGDYTINFTIQDLQGANTTQQINITVFERSIPPNITAVRPWFNASIFGTETETKISTAIVGNNTTATLQEGGTYTFNLSYIDLDTAPENVTMRWYIDGNLTQETTADQPSHLTVTYGFFDEGTYEYVAVVEDNRLAQDNFTWNVFVQNTNRPPITCYELTSRNVTSTTQITDYMFVFYDPDDHPDHTQPDDECSTQRTFDAELTYAANISNPEVIDIEFTGEDVTLRPLEDGIVTVTYVATDPFGELVATNPVSYQVAIPEEVESPTPTPSTGGGGSSPRPVPFPFTQDPEPLNIDILTPSSLVMYRNQTMEVPITVRNPTERVFTGVEIDASVEVDDVQLRFTQNTFAQLQPEEERNITLLVDNYRSQGTYEIKVTADVRDPEVNDSALIFVNALEQESFGDAVNTRVSFAQDLLTSNPECLELNEQLNRARTLLQEGRTHETDLLLREVVDACRFLIAAPGAREEIPAGWDVSWFTQMRYANQVLLGLLGVLVLIAVFLLMHYYSAARQDP